MNWTLWKSIAYDCMRVFATLFSEQNSEKGYFGVIYQCLTLSTIFTSLLSKSDSHFQYENLGCIGAHIIHWDPAGHQSSYDLDHSWSVGVIRGPIVIIWKPPSTCDHFLVVRHLYVWLIPSIRPVYQDFVPTFFPNFLDEYFPGLVWPWSQKESC